jgi:hypothetical protein
MADEAEAEAAQRRHERDERRKLAACEKCGKKIVDGPRATCSSCHLPYHLACAHVTASPPDDWVCKSCTKTEGCDICQIFEHEPAKRAQLLKCRTCNAAYHRECLESKPGEELPAAGTKMALCPDCVRVDLWLLLRSFLSHLLLYRRQSTEKSWT